MEWRNDPNSKLYECKLIHDRIQEMKQVDKCRNQLSGNGCIHKKSESCPNLLSSHADRSSFALKMLKSAFVYVLQLEEQGDLEALSYWLRSGLMRGLGGITDARLFERLL